MENGIRAARDQVATERTLRAADILGDRFGVEFDPTAIGRVHKDPAVRALFGREGVADFLDALVAATAPNVPLPTQEERMEVMTVAEIRDLVKDADLNTVVNLFTVERNGPNRKTAIDAIERRRTELREAYEAEQAAARNATAAASADAMAELVIAGESVDADEAD